MAKKADLLEQAKNLNLEVTDKNTIVEIQNVLKKAETTSKPQLDETEKPVLAKSGKRSAKGLEKAEAKAEKVEQQKHHGEITDETVAKPTSKVNPARPRSERKGKKYQEAFKQIDHTKTYELKDAIELAKKLSQVKFDASVEVHINLNVDPRQADQNIRGSVVLPHGTGRKIRIAVFDDGKITNADLSGTESISKQLEKGEINFDVLIASPANMAKLGKYARLLGPRGLMPNPKTGTVTTDINKAVSEARAGKVDYRVDSTGIIHSAFGKVSFQTSDLVDNANSILDSVNSAKPNSSKGVYIKSIYVSTTMGPSLNIKI